MGTSSSRNAIPYKMKKEIFNPNHSVSLTTIRVQEVFEQSPKDMEARKLLRSDKNRLKHRPLTPIRFLRGLLCLVVFFFTAFMFLVYFAPVGAVMLRLFSLHYSRKASSFLFGLWLALWPFLFEKINGTKVVFSGDMVPKRERVLLIANHRTEVDWMYLWDLAVRKGCLGHMKYILKSSLMKLPVLGWGFHILEFIAVERKWEIDESVLCNMLSTFKNPQDPLWLVLFPEGTDFNEEKCKRSREFAAEAKLPVMFNVLLPKTKGFCFCLEGLRGSLNAVYDVTIAYKHQCPSFMDNAFGLDPSEVHIHVRRIPIDEIPASDDDTAAWLTNTFQHKDQLLSYFKDQGYFPNQGTEAELSTLKCLINFTVVIFLTMVFAYLTFSSSIWFKIYVGLACVYLGSATYFNIQTVPILGFVRAMFYCKNHKNE